MPDPSLVLTNNFGETTENVVGDESTLGPSTQLLTGLVAGTNTPITAADTVLEALANLQAQIDALA